jgi:hypothetical protein
LIKISSVLVLSLALVILGKVVVILGVMVSGARGLLLSD